MHQLGLLAGVFTDGRIHIFDIPKPNGAAVSYSASFNPVFFGTPDGLCAVKANPLLSLHIPGTNITCLDWCSHERIVAGCENGYMAVWDVKDALLSSEPVQHLRPVHYLSNQEGAIRKICVVQIPPPGPDLKLNDLAEPTMIATTGFDGSHQLVDLRDPRTASALLHFRGKLTDISWGCCSSAEMSDQIWAASSLMIIIETTSSPMM